MDSRQSLEFIRTLIARSKKDPEMKAILKKATLMSKMAQVFSSFDDGHLENLYEMNVNRAGAKMFLKALAGEGKAPKQVVIQSHPNHIKEFQKFFPSAVPFQILEMEESLTDWENSTTLKTKKDGEGFYNDLNLLVNFLKKIGVKAPFKIKVTGKTELTLTYVEQPPEPKLLFDGLMAAANALKENMSSEREALEELKELQIEVADLRDDLGDAKEKEEQYQRENSRLRGVHQMSEYKVRNSNAPLDSDEYKELLEAVPKAKAIYEKSSEKLQKLMAETNEIKAKYDEARSRMRELNRNNLSERVAVWDSLDWDGGTPNEAQLGTLINIIGGEYTKLRGNLPYKKVITVRISCAIKSSSAGYDQGNFKNLKDFIKTKIF